MIYNKKNNSSIIPTPATNCFEKRCVNLHVNKNIELRPFELTEIDLELIVDIPTGHVLRIINHFNKNPWQILTKVIYHTDEKQDLKLYVVSSSFCSLKSGDILCHAQINSIEDLYSSLKSKLIIFEVFLNFSYTHFSF
jgi:hypothetical protein